MPRPRKYYPIFRWGQPVAIAHGLAAAKAMTTYDPPQGPVGRSFTTRLAAEEWAAWMGYENSRSPPPKLELYVGTREYIEHYKL